MYIGYIYSRLHNVFRNKSVDKDMTVQFKQTGNKNDDGDNKEQEKEKEEKKKKKNGENNDIFETLGQRQLKNEDKK